MPKKLRPRDVHLVKSQLTARLKKRSGIPSDQPFGLHEGLWHALKIPQGAGTTFKMVCGIEVRGLSAPYTRTRDGDPKPQPWCLNCVEKFYN